MSGFETPRALSTRKIPFQYGERDIYRYLGAVNDAHLIFSDITITQDFPIVLLGNWTDSEISPEMMDILAFQHVGNPRSIVFITKNENDETFGEVNGITFDIQVFERKNEENIPLVYTEQLHSSHNLSWEALPKSATINLELQKHLRATQTKVAENLK